MNKLSRPMRIGVTLGAALALTVGISLPAYANGSIPKACNGTSAVGFSNASQGYTALASGSTSGQCGTLAVRSYYTVTTDGSKDWTTWHYSATDAAVGSPGAGYPITKSEHYTAYNATWTT